MSSVHNSVETVNAAASAIVTADSRIQPSAVQKRRWGSFWSLYWCFGSFKNGKRIGHAVLLPESRVTGISAPVVDNSNQPTTIVLPFIAPPSSPASFLQSDPPSSTQSPARCSIASLSINSCSPCETASIFRTGPYADETQLVTPPVFSAFTTEPSTASFTPPPEPVHVTRPSSPEVPFAELLSSSLACNRKKYEGNPRLPLSQYDYQPYQYPGSPGSRIMSPGSTIPNSGTSSPFPDKRTLIKFRMGEAPNYLGYEHFARKWGSRLGSGSLTPNGWGSRLGSGDLTPNGDISRLGSGTITPTGVDTASGDVYLLKNQISEVASLANSDNEYQNEEIIVDPRVSFELISEVVRRPENEAAALNVTVSEPSSNKAVKASEGSSSASMRAENGGENSMSETTKEVKSLEGEGEMCLEKHRSGSLGSSKDFNFDSTKQELLDKSMIDCEWWTNDKGPERELDSQNKWTFFPALPPSVSL